MELEKKEIIKSYLLDKEVPLEERRKRFEIVWDIGKNFDRIMEDMRKELAYKIVEQINTDEFIRGNYEIRNSGFDTKGCRDYPITVYKPTWEREENEPLIFFALEFTRAQFPYFMDLRFGIKKSNSISFKNLSPEQKEILEKIRSKLEKEFGKNWLTENQWIACLNFDSYGNEWTMWRKEFHDKFFSKENFSDSVEEVAEFYINEFKKLIRTSEKEIDSLVNLLK